MIAAELAELLGLDDVGRHARVGRRHHRRHRRRRARLRRRDPRRAAASHRRRARRARRRRDRAAPGRWPAPPTAISYDYRLVVTPQAVRPGRRHGALAVAGRRSPPPAAAHVNPLDLDRIGVAEGSRGPHRRRRGTVVLPLAADDGVPRGIAAVPFNVPGADDHATSSTSTAPATDVRMERL